MYNIDYQKCNGCAACLETCKSGAIYLLNNKAQIDQSRCTECGACVEVCPNDAIKIVQTEQQQYPVSINPSPRQSIMSAVKSSAIAVGSALLPVVISKLGSLLSSKLENLNRPSSPANQNFMNSGMRIRNRSRRGKKQ